MKKVFIIDGGAGRVVAAIPALEKYVTLHPEEDIHIVIFGWDNLVWGNTLLQDITYNADTKGIFDSFIKDCDVIVSPEPYRVPAYFNQKISLIEAFDVAINGTTDHTDLPKLKLYTNKAEEKNAANIIADVRDQQKKQKTIVIQPFGRSARVDRGDIIDDSSRGLDSAAYLKLVKKLSTKYNLILFAEKEFHLPEDTFTMKLEMELRIWLGIIDSCDYFIGCDSVGQHIARAFDKKGSIILGSTFAINTSYPDWFNIIEKEGVKKYTPIRICGLDEHLAYRYNDKCMDFSDEEINTVFLSIVNDIEKKADK